MVKLIHITVFLLYNSSDLKPQNLLMFQNGKQIKICDFGTSRKCIEESMTRNQGSMLYMAPEMRCSKHYNSKVDVFSYGIVLSEIVTRDQPYGGDFHEMMKEEGPQKLPQEPAEFVGLMKSLWLKNPADRPDMRDVGRELDIILKKYLKGDSIKR